MMDYTDEGFIHAFESGTLEAFHHRDHARLALLYVGRFGMPEAERRLCAAIRAFATRAGNPEKYHHTMTIAYVRLAAHLLDKAALTRYYSADLLSSRAARDGWVEPDLERLPQ